MDTSESLLKELQYHRGDRPVQTICADVLKLGELVPPSTAEVIVCMGDTLTHLVSTDAVEELLRSISALSSRGANVS